jgi:putative RNA 2'-phosphotransferase
MISEKEKTKISKFLSLVLRHRPETIGIVLDQNGWTSVETLLEGLNKNNIKLDKTILKHIVETNPKKRFSFNDSNNKIRANQGHSVDVELGYISQRPPAILYHGTGQKSVSSILETGLEKRKRHQVHLSNDLETAIIVGQRHGKPFVFKILAEQMHEDGYQFYLSENGVWLTDAVPPKYLAEYEAT